MTADIFLVLLILGVALVLLVTEWVRMDLVALLVLGGLALAGLVTAEEALAGFGNPAVVTIWAMFILGDGLTRTGIANLIGRYLQRLGGSSESRMVLVIMLTAGGLSAFMPNIGVAALMLPVVMDLSRRTGHAPSRLLMPLAFACLLGGLTTLIGTPPNLLISNALQAQGLEPFKLFDFTPVGLPVLLAGTVFVSFFGLRLLPNRDPARETSPNQRDLSAQYGLKERTYMMRVPPGSILSHRSLAESRLGLVLGLNVIALMRDGRTELSPGPGKSLREGDRLIVQGHLERFNDLQRWSELKIELKSPKLQDLISGQLEFYEARLASESSLAGKTLHHANFRRTYGVNVLAIRRGDSLRRTYLSTIPLEPGDRLLVEGTHERLETIRKAEAFDELRPLSQSDLSEVYRLQERVFVVRLPPQSKLAGKTVAESRLGDAFDFRLLGAVRKGGLELMPDPEATLQEGDELLIQGRQADLEVLQGLQQLQVERGATPDLSRLESEKYALIEAVLSPRSALAGKTLPELEFRDRYGLQVLALWREGQAHRDNLRDFKLQFGDALLLWGHREKLLQLDRDPDFIVLTQGLETAPKTRKAPLAALIMLAVVIPAMLGWMHIAVAAVTGAAVMVLTGCLTMEQAYRSIEWRSIFVIAGMLPLGVAMNHSGAAAWLAENFMTVAGELGAWPVLICLYVITSASTMVIPTPVLVVLMSPIVLSTCTQLEISPYAGMMAMSMAASASFTSPISHPANVLVMGPGGYRFADYLRMGFPLALVVLIVVLLTLPWFWPL